jgi:hypothetical protein
MVTQRKVKTDPRGFIQELEAIILSRYPDAEFEVTQIGSEEYDMVVHGNHDDMFDVLEHTSPRATDILIDHGIFIHVLPLGRRISKS